MSDLEELRRLSEAATPGRWRTFGMTLMVGGDGDYEDATEVAHFLTERDGHPRTFDLDLACALVNAYRDGSLSNPALSVSTEGVADLDVERLANVMRSRYGDEGWHLVLMSADGGVVPARLSTAFIQAVATAYSAAINPDSPVEPAQSGDVPRGTMHMASNLEKETL